MKPADIAWVTLTGLDHLTDEEPILMGMLGLAWLALLFGGAWLNILWAMWAGLSLGIGIVAFVEGKQKP